LLKAIAGNCHQLRAIETKSGCLKSPVHPQDGMQHVLRTMQWRLATGSLISQLVGDSESDDDGDCNEDE